MLFKWFVGGAILGGIGGLFIGDFVGPAFLGGIIAIALRKWIFRTFWS